MKYQKKKLNAKTTVGHGRHQQSAASKATAVHASHRHRRMNDNRRRKQT
jgi:hypothetical protein